VDLVAARVATVAAGAAPEVAMAGGKAAGPGEATAAAARAVDAVAAAHSAARLEAAGGLAEEGPLVVVAEAEEAGGAMDLQAAAPPARALPRYHHPSRGSAPTR